MSLSAHLLPSTWTIPCLYSIWCTQRIFPNLDWRRVSWNAVSWYLIVLSGGRAEVSLLLVAVSQRRCWSRVSSQQAAWDQLSTGSTRCPLSPSLLKGSWTWSCSFCDLFKQLILWSPEAPQAWYMSSQDCEVDVCSQIHYWQKFTCLGGHRCAQPGRWQECLVPTSSWGRLQLTSLRRASSSSVNNCRQYEMQNFWAWDAKGIRTLYACCKHALTAPYHILYKQKLW